MNINENCRYIKCGICTATGELCNNCQKQTRSIKYTYSYNPFSGTTRISIVNAQGHKYITAEIFGQLTEIAIKSYAIDMCKMLMEKGVL